MRIYSSDTDQVYDKLEIFLTLEQAEDFATRINDMANNPLNKEDELLDDVITGEVDENNFILTEIDISRYNKNFIGKYFDERGKIIILYDK